MSYTVESINGCKKKIVFNFKELDLTGQIKAALLKKRSEVAIKGFRKGKAPVAMVEKMYRPEVEADAINSFIQENYIKAITTEELKVADYPSVENMKYDPGKTISFDCFVEIFPDIKIADMKQYKFTKDKVEVSDDDVEKTKVGYLNSKAEIIPVEGSDVTLSKGHQALLNFEGVKEDGERPENMKGSEFPLEIGSGQFIPGFEDGMVGMKKGEKKFIPLTFPTDYGAEELRGAKVTFEVELLDIKEKKLPEFTEELAKEFGFDSITDFNVKTKERITENKKREATEKLKKDIIDKLLKENHFDVPEVLLGKQKEHVKDDLKRSLLQQGFSEDSLSDYYKHWDSDITAKAVFQLRSGLLLDKLASDYKIEVTDKDFEAKLDNMAQSMNLPLETIKQYYSKGEIKNNMMYSLREEKTFEKIMEQVVVL